jgi:hypothetical protein
MLKGRFIMKNTRSTIQIIKKRPIILWLMAIITFTYLLIDKYNPIMPILFGLGRVTGGNIFEGIVSFIQLIVDPAILPYVLAALVGISIVASILLGIFFSGYFNILNNAIVGAPRVKREFSSGVKNHSIKLIFVTFRVIFLGLLLFLFMGVASIPAVVLARMRTVENGGLNIPSLLIITLTAMVLYFLFAYFRTYVLFWYPSVIKKIKKPFLTARKLVNENFWSLVAGYIIFDAILIAFFIMLGKTKNATQIFIAKWIFLTFFIILHASYTFHAYERYKGG